MRDFDWNLIKSFLAVIEHETMLRASKALKSSQPTIGRHISELETITGLTLFDRSRNGMRPTDAALSLANQARDMQREADGFAMLATSRDETLSGTVRVTASQIVANFVLPEIIAKFRQTEPGIQIELVSSNHIQNLLSRDADIAVRMAQPTQNDIIARKVNDFSMGAYAHKTYLENRPHPNSVEDLSQHTLLGYDRDNLIIDGMAVHGITMNRNNFGIRTDDQVAYWHLLCAGAGIGFAPQYMATKNKDLKRLFEDLPIAPLPMWLASHHELRTNLRIRRTMDFLYEALSKLPLN